MYWRPDPLSIPPQLGVGGGIPNPRKLKPASTITTAGIRILKSTIMGAMILGKISRISILRVEHPVAAAADTYMFCLTLITVPLMILEPPIP